MSVGGKYNKYGTAHAGSLTDEDCEQRLQQLMVRLKDLLPLSAHDCGAPSDEEMLIKFLTARHYDLDKAEAMVRQCVKCRKENEYEKLLVDTIDPEVVSRWPSGFLTAADKEGHPVYIERPKSAEMKEVLSKYGVDAVFRWHLYCAEQQRQLMLRWSTDRVSIIIDGESFSPALLANKQALALYYKICTQNQAVYPEQMRFLFVINAPRSVQLGWSMLSSVLDPVVRLKVHIWGTDYAAKLAEHIPRAQLPVELGGESPEPVRWLTGDPAKDTPMLPPPPREVSGNPSDSNSASAEIAA